MTRYGVRLVACWLALWAAAAPAMAMAAEPTIAPADLQQDLNVLEHAYRELHPGLLRYRSQWDSKSWLDAHLDRLSQDGFRVLIIDLRGNEGGDDVGDEIVKRLIVVDLQPSAMKRLVRYRSVPPELVPYVSTWDPGFKDWGAEAQALIRPWPTAPPVNYFGLAGKQSESDAHAVLHPVAPHFAGRVFVIVDAANSSATFQFEQVMQQHQLGLLFGQPTGGNRRGINGGAFFFLNLPHSHIELDLPLIGTFPPVEAPDAGH